MIQILNCNTNLGSCCNDAGLKSIFSLINNIISIIQIIAPILLIIMIIVDLTKLIKDPDDKKLPKSIKNKLNAAVILFFIPVIVNAFLSISTSSGSNIISCMKESRNIKLSANAKYIPVEDNTNKQVALPSSSKDYEKGKPKEKSNQTNSQVTPGEKISPTSCVVGDKNVKVVNNDSNRHAKIVRKANGQAVAEYAKSWIGKGLTYDFGSTSDLRAGGTCDCSHFVYQVLKHFGIIEGGQIRTTVWGSCNVEGTTLYSDMSKIVPGDVLFEYFGGTTAHVEIYIGNGESIGCNAGRGVTRGHNAKNYTTFIHLSAYD